MALTFISHRFHLEALVKQDLPVSPDPPPPPRRVHPFCLYFNYLFVSVTLQGQTADGTSRSRGSNFLFHPFLLLFSKLLALNVVILPCPKKWIMILS
jgi:hypothetical protein